MSRNLSSFLFFGLAVAFTDATDFERNLRSAPYEDEALRLKFYQGVVWLKGRDNFPSLSVNLAAGSLLSELEKVNFVNTTIKPIEGIKMRDKEAFISYFKTLKKKFGRKSAVRKAADSLQSAFKKANQTMKRRFVKSLEDISKVLPSANELLIELRNVKFAPGYWSGRFKSMFRRFRRKKDEKLKLSDPLFSRILNWLADSDAMPIKSVNGLAQRLIQKLRVANVGFVSPTSPPTSPSALAGAASPSPLATPSNPQPPSPSPAAQSGRGLVVGRPLTSRTLAGVSRVTARTVVRKSYCC